MVGEWEELSFLSGEYLMEQNLPLGFILWFNSGWYLEGSWH